MNNSIFVSEIQLDEILVMKLHSVGYLNCLTVSLKNQLAEIVLKVNYYVPPILHSEIPVMVGAGFLVNDDFTTEGSEGSEGCIIVATRNIKIFPFRNSGFQC